MLVQTRNFALTVLSMTLTDDGGQKRLAILRHNGRHLMA